MDNAIPSAPSANVLHISPDFEAPQGQAEIRINLPDGRLITAFGAFSMIVGPIKPPDPALGLAFDLVRSWAMQGATLITATILGPTQGHPVAGPALTQRAIILFNITRP